MKKIYNVPATTVVALNVHQMLAASNPGVTVNTSNDPSNRVDAGDVETRQKNNGIGSGLWSDMQ